MLEILQHFVEAEDEASLAYPMPPRPCPQTLTHPTDIA